MISKESYDTWTKHFHPSPTTLLTTFNHRTWAEGHAGLDRIAADAPGTALRNEQEDSFQAFHSAGLGMLVLNALT